MTNMDKAQKRINLGHRLESARRATKLTQSEVARRLGVSLFTVTDHEAGRNAPNAMNLAAYAKLYGVTADTLLDAMNVAQVPSFGCELDPAVLDMALHERVLLLSESDRECVGRVVNAMLASARAHAV